MAHLRRFVALDRRSESQSSTFYESESFKAVFISRAQSDQQEGCLHYKISAVTDISQAFSQVFLGSSIRYSNIASCTVFVGLRFFFLIIF